VVAFAAILLVQTVPKLLDMNGSALADEPLPFCMCGKAFAKCPLAHCIYAFCALAVAIFASWREFRRDGTRSTF
jgi:hypothetical protein